MENLEKASFDYRDLLLKKLYYPLLFSVLTQVITLHFYLFIVNFNILHPIEWINSTLYTVTRLSTWFVVLCFLAVVFLQSVVCAKDYIKGAAYKPNRFQKIMSIFSAHNFLLLVLHVLIGGSLVWLYLSLSRGRYEYLWDSCKQSVCLNEGKFFLILGGFWTGCYYFVKIYISGRYLTFPVIHQRKLSQFKLKLVPILQKSFLQSILPTIYFLILYRLFGTDLQNSLSSFFRFEDESSGSLVRMYFLLWLFGTLYCLNMNLTKFYFNLYITEPIEFPLLKYSFNNSTLQEGILFDELPVIQSLACLDLYLLSRWCPTRRQLLFTLSQPGGHPHNWNNLISAVLKLFSHYTELLNMSTETMIMKDKIKPGFTSSSINYPSDNITPTPALLGPSTLQSPNKYRDLRNMSLYNNTSFDQTDYVTNVTQVKPLGESLIIKKVSEKLDQFVRVSRTLLGIDYLFGKLPQVNIQKCLANGNLIIWTSEGIADLVVASLKEDQFGVVQKDLPVIVTTLVQLRQSVEKLSRIPALAKRFSSTDDFNYKMNTAVLSAIKRSLFAICLHFGDYMNDLNLSKDVMQHLQLHVFK